MNDEYNDWRIEQETLAKARVFVDGVELKGVKSIRYTTAVDEAPSIFLEIIPESVNYQVDSTDSTSQHIGLLPQKPEGGEQ